MIAKAVTTKYPVLNRDVDLLGAASAPALSRPGRARFFYNTTTDEVEISKNGGAYATFGGAGGGGDVTQGGNTFGAAMLIGSNDAFDLQLRAGNANRVTIGNAFGSVSLAPTAASSSPAILFQIIGTSAVHTAQTAEVKDVNFGLSRLVTFTGGSVPTLQRAVVFDAPTYNSPAADTMDIAATVAISGAPVQAGSLTITDAYSLYCQDNVLIRKDQNGTTSLVIENAQTSPTTAAISTMALRTDLNNTANLIVYATGYTSSGLAIADSLRISSGTFMSGGVTIDVAATAGDIRFGLNGVIQGRFKGSSGTPAPFIVGPSDTIWASETVNVNREQNLLTYIRVVNNTSGTAAQSGFVGDSNAGNVNLAVTNTAYTTVGSIVASQAYLSTTVAGGLNIVTTAAVPLIFGTNSTNRGRFLSTGEFIVGIATAVLSGEDMLIRRDQNALTELAIYNDTAGTGAGSSISILSNSASGYLITTDDGWTPGAGRDADQLIIESGSDASGGLNLHAAFATGTIRQKTNQVERFRVDSNETADETSLQTTVSGSALQRISVGANDSGGAGFRVLRVPN